MRKKSEDPLMGSFKRLLLFLLFSLCIAVVWALWGQDLTGFRISKNGIRMSRNLHEVDPGKFFRSAQLTGPELQEVIDKHKIKTIINLQGERPGFDWYDDEERVARENDVQLISISMALDPVPRREYLIQLLDALRDSPRPILLHCRSGSDRTGEATAIYRIEYMGHSKQDALTSLAWKYWHTPITVPSKMYFMKEVYKGEAWMRENYDHCAPGLQYADRTHCEPGT